MDTSYLGIPLIRSSAELKEVLPSLPGGRWQFCEPEPFDAATTPHLVRYCSRPSTVTMINELGEAHVRIVNSSRPYATNMAWTKIDGFPYFLIIVEPKGGSRCLTANSPTGEINRMAGQTNSQAAAAETREESGIQAKPEYAGNAFVWASAQKNPEQGIISVFTTYVESDTTYEPPAHNPQEPVTAFWISLQVVREMVSSGNPLRLEADFLIAVGMAALTQRRFVEALYQTD